MSICIALSSMSFAAMAQSVEAVPPPPSDATSANGTAEALAVRALALSGPAATPDDLRAARALLDRLVAEHPSSDLAVAVILQADPGGVDVADLNRRIAAARGEGDAGVDRPTAAAMVDPIAGASAADPAACVAAALPVAPSAPLVLAVEMDLEGRVKGLPVPASGATLDASGRASLLAAVAALDACAPFPEALRGRAVEAVFAVDGSASLRAAEPPARGIDVTPDAETQAPVAGSPSQPEAAPAGTPETEADLALDRQAIRDVQARLLVSGHDPNGVDGRIGPGTRAALRAWQAAQGIAATGYLGAEQLVSLRQASQRALDGWLADTANARRYEPPPPPDPIALTPRRLSGTWDTTTRCVANSRLGQRTIRSAMTVVHAGGGTFRGRIATSQGLRGDVVLTLRGRTMEGTANYGLLIGRTSFRGQFADQSLAVSGRDSNGCSFAARKR